MSKPMHGNPAEETGWALLAEKYSRWSDEKDRARRHQEVLDRWEAEMEWSRDYEQAVRP